MEDRATRLLAERDMIINRMHKVIDRLRAELKEAKVETGGLWGGLCPHCKKPISTPDHRADDKHEGVIVCEDASSDASIG